MEHNTKWVSKQRLLRLELTGIGLGNGDVYFEFKDKQGRIYEHYQVFPSRAGKGINKAANYFRKITSGRVSFLDVTTPSEHLLDPLKEFLNRKFAVLVRKRIMDNGATYFDVEEIAQNSIFTNQQELKDIDDNKWLEDIVEMSRLAKKFSKALKTTKNGNRLVNN